MKLSKLINNIKVDNKINFADVEVSGVSYNSKETKKGDLFVCIKGFVVDGHNYYKNAIENGAIAILTEKELPTDVPQILVCDTRRVLADIAANFYDNPSDKLNLIGVTGTNGKTTVTHLLQKILEEHQEKTALIGTLGYKLCCADNYKSEDRTTPQALELQQLFRSFVDGHAVKNVLMEVSSHALEQNRVGRCNFNGAVLTNLTQDHLDYHKTMDEYFKAKAILFAELKEGGFAVINADDLWADKFLKEVPLGVEVVTYGIDKKADLMATNVEYNSRGASFVCDCAFGKRHVDLKMNGKFGVYNSLAAIATAISMGVDFDVAIEVLENVAGVAGRFEVVCNHPMVVIDYAHTPDGLENALKAAKEIIPKGGKLIALFGCGGNRDVTKRPIMGKIAEDIADVVVVTSDNPRREDPQTIIDDILRGMSKECIVEMDRGVAIEKIKEFANQDDVILLAGKGHETYQILADKTIEFSDKEWAKKVFG